MAGIKKRDFKSIYKPAESSAHIWKYILLKENKYYHYLFFFQKNAIHTLPIVFLSNYKLLCTLKQPAH